ncbi:MAG: phage infection protein [Flavobacterium sp.]|nr:MAG: phage infection protein [Flavobacterium sp.]
MDNLKIDLQNCYGITSLKHDFDFSKCSAFVVYAPNGVMKTSFAKTFQNIAEFKSPSERIHNSPCSHKVLADESPIKPEQIFVVNSYQDKYSPDDIITTLLVDEESKLEYDTIYTDILKKKNGLIAKLNRLSGIKKDEIERNILKDFDDVELLTFLTKLDLCDTDISYSDVQYATIFDKDVLEFLQKEDIVHNLEKYVEKYNQLLEESKYFSKGIFNPTRADAIAKSLKSENFFKAKHKLKLNGDEDEIDSHEKLIEKMGEECKTILQNPELVKVESEIKKASIVKFRELLEKHTILPELQDLNKFRRTLWLSYLKEEEISVKELVKTFLDGKVKLEEIENKAIDQKTLWDEVVAKFNNRFHVPFKIDVANKANAILGKSTPNVVFKFENRTTGKFKELKRQELDSYEVLSQGEKRALYLLNIMFSIEARIKDQKDTLFIIDDIADSFDYKNKYAIVQYLKDINGHEFFRQLIMTHNFDFFRTLQSRGIATYNNCLYTYRTNNGIKLVVAQGLKNPFIDWKRNLKDDKKLIASISFIRNILEYTEGEENSDYIKLTSLLHKKSDTETITFQELEDIYHRVMPGIDFPSKNKDDSVYALINEVGKSCLDAPEGINLENKIVLSIAIRLKAETYMLSLLTDKSECKGGSQTGKLFGRFRSEFAESKESDITLLEEVCLMTPENIHLNSFMYEPILDMSDEHLRVLYKKLLDTN